MRICKEGWPFIVGCFIVGSMVLEAGQALHSGWMAGLAGVFFLATAFCTYFFRDPKRVPPADDQLVLSPADGKILEIVEEKQENATVWVLRIFLSVFEPHLQRSPVDGTVRALRYREGKFLDARDPKAPFENEQNRIEIVPASGRIQAPVVVTQIAGLIARRIRCWVKEGQSVKRGERIGLIQFGSQVDMTLPQALRLKVKAGDHVKAGESIIAEVV